MLARFQDDDGVKMIDVEEGESTLTLEELGHMHNAGLSALFDYCFPSFDILDSPPEVLERQHQILKVMIRSAWGEGYIANTDASDEIATVLMADAYYQAVYAPLNMDGNLELECLHVAGIVLRAMTEVTA